MAKRKAPPPEPAPAPAPDNAEDRIVSKVVDQLKPQLKSHIESLRQDLLADVKEHFAAPAPAPAPVPVPAVQQAAPNPMGGLNGLSGLLKQLGGQNGQIDMSQIGNLINQIPQGAPPNIDAMSDKQLEYLKGQQMTQLLSGLLPSLVQQSQGNPMLNELMSRLFLEKMGVSMYMDRAMIQMMIKSMGMGGMDNMKNPLTAPIEDVAAKMQAEREGVQSKQAVP